MNSVTVSKRQRLEAGAAMLRAYQQSGLSVSDWLRRNNVSKDKFYYWRHRLRDLCLDEMELAPASAQPSFVEVSVPGTVIQETLTADNAAASVRIRGCEFRLYNTVSSSFLRNLIEASSHAE